MTIPLLEYAPSSQNQRVINFDIPGDEQPRLYSTDNLLSASEIDALIQVAYRQVFNEQQMLSFNRQKFLESQLKAGQITVREFIRGLATSDSFRRLNYDSNDNYRFAQMCVQRLLGRDVYSDREKLSLSIILATKGLNGFIDELLNSEEYRSNFGDNTVPYQRRRILAQRSEGEVTFNHMARYGTRYRNQLPRQSAFGAFRGVAGPFTGPAQFQPITSDDFMQSINWSKVGGLSIVTATLITGLLFLFAALGTLGA
jgi:phycobilisome rod-core linker protein